MSLAAFRQALDRKTGELRYVQRELETAATAQRDLVLQSRYCEEAQAIIQNIAQLTQQELEFHISGLVTLALAAVFDDPYEFVVKFEQRRNRTECDLWFKRGDQLIDPMTASGGGAVEVAAFALRVALWSMAKPRTRATFLLDEELKFLKGDILPERGARMMQDISSRLGIQIIMVSHVPDQIEGADRRIDVKLRNGESQVRLV